MTSREGVKRLAIVLAGLLCATVAFICLERKFTFGTLILSLLMSLFAIGALWGFCQTVRWVLKGFRSEQDQ
ncbi:MAG: hypothetical protein JSU94_17580 [Phycisphaerales bacterium]|nr:MAG: hypothetical protein JSU94_17580 [Phycisphaerales bacterium]